MKLSLLTTFVALLVLLPQGALAQTEEGEGGQEETPPADGTAPPTEGAEAAPVEEAAPPPPVQPEPEVAATGTESDAEQTTAPQPGVTNDLADAEAEAAPPPAETLPDGAQEGMRYDLETGRWVADVDPLPWRNTLLLWDHSVSADTFFRGARLSYNPEYVQTFSLRPRWYLTDSISIRAREDLAWELTDTDDYTLNRQAVFSDLQAGIYNTKIVTLPYDIPVGGGLYLYAPLSIVSRNCNMVLGVEGAGSLTKVWGEVLSGLTVQLYGSLRYIFHTKNVCSFESDVYASQDEDYAGLLTGGGLTGLPNANDPDSINQPGGASNADLRATAGINASLQLIPELSLDFLYGGRWFHGRPLADACFTVDSDPSGTLRCIPDDSQTKLRVQTEMSIGLTYYPNNWLNVAVAWGVLNSQLSPDGSWYNPFYNPETAGSLTATFYLDNVYLAIAKAFEGDEEEAPTARRNRTGTRASRALLGAAQ